MHKNKHSGFTIVELLIVIVVIAILAAISIIAYNGIQRRAAIAVVQSDLKNFGTQIGLAHAESGVFPGADDDVEESWTESGTWILYTRYDNGASYCATAANTERGIV